MIGREQDERGGAGRGGGVQKEKLKRGETLAATAEDQPLRFTGTRPASPGIMFLIRQCLVFCLFSIFAPFSLFLSDSLGAPQRARRHQQVPRSPLEGRLSAQFLPVRLHVVICHAN